MEELPGIFYPLPLLGLQKTRTALPTSYKPAYFLDSGVIDSLIARGQVSNKSPVKCTYSSHVASSL